MERRTRYLLDSHIWIKWALTGKIPQRHLKILEDPSLEKCLSCISIWELAMLVSKGRVRLELSTKYWVALALENTGVTLLNLTPEIAVLSCDLPGTLHADPMDRILIATALQEKLVLLTEDKEILRYAKKGGVKCG